MASSIKTPVRHKGSTGRTIYNIFSYVFGGKHRQLICDVSIGMYRYMCSHMLQYIYTSVCHISFMRRGPDCKPAIGLRAMGSRPRVAPNSLPYTYICV